MTDPYVPPGTGERPSSGAVPPPVPAGAVTPAAGTCEEPAVPTADTPGGAGADEAPTPAVAPALPDGQRWPAASGQPAPPGPWEPGGPPTALATGGPSVGAGAGGWQPGGTPVGGPVGPDRQPAPFGAPPGWHQPPTGAGFPAGQAGPRRSLLPVLATVLACVLVVVAVVQTVLLVRTNSALKEQKHSVAAAQSRDDKRLKSLESTVKALEERAKKSLDAAAVAKKVLPSVFQVVAGDYTGSSFVVGSAPGGGSYLLTNDHVVQPLLDSGSKHVKLERSDASFPATVVRHDKTLDIAVLKCDQKFDALTVSRSVQPGEPVVVVGSPLGLNDTVTTGVVSSARRNVPGSDEKFIQFDAAINPGNSGGPVMNAKGEVVGIASEKARDAEGIGLAIPISVPCDKFSVCGS